MGLAETRQRQVLERVRRPLRLNQAPPPLLCWAWNSGCSGVIRPSIDACIFSIPVRKDKQEQFAFTREG